MSFLKLFFFTFLAGSVSAIGTKGFFTPSSGQPGALSEIRYVEGSAETTGSRKVIAKSPQKEIRDIIEKLQQKYLVLGEGRPLPEPLPKVILIQPDYDTNSFFELGLITLHPSFFSASAISVREGILAHELSHFVMNQWVNRIILPRAIPAFSACLSLVEKGRSAFWSQAVPLARKGEKFSSLVLETLEKNSHCRFTGASMRGLGLHRIFQSLQELFADSFEATITGRPESSYDSSRFLHGQMGLKNKIHLDARTFDSRAEKAFDKLSAEDRSDPHLRYARLRQALAKTVAFRDRDLKGLLDLYSASVSAVFLKIDFLKEGLGEGGGPDSVSDLDQIVREESVIQTSWSRLDR